MQNKGFLYWLLNKDKKPLYQSQADQVLEADPDTLLTAEGVPSHLKYSPDGWKGTLIKYARNVKYLGLTRDYTVPMIFVKDGARIIKDFFWRFGRNAILYFVIKKLNRTTFPDFYDDYYVGELDLSKASHDKDSIKVQVVEGGLSKLLKANENTKFEIPIDTDPEKKVLYHDGLTFVQKVEYYVSDGMLVSNNGQHTLQAEINSSEQLNAVSQLGAVSANRAHFKNNNELLAQNNYVVKTSANATEMTITFDIGVTVDLADGIPVFPGDGGRLLARVFNDLGVATDGIVLKDYGSGATLYQHHRLTGSVTFTVPPYSRVFICNFFTVGGTIASSSVSEAVFWFYDNNVNDFIRIDYTARYKPSLVEFLTPITLFNRIVEKITDGMYSVKSDFLLSLNDLAITSGPALRKYKAPAVIKTSLSDFFKSLQRYGIGLSVENEMLVIEKHDYFFKKDVAFDLGVVDDVEIVVAEDLVFNTLKVGYPNQEIDKVNGRDEFNVTLQFKAPENRIIKELDLVSIYRADMYGIEITRIDLLGKDTTDNKADNDTFMINVSKGATITYYYGAFKTQVNSGQYFISIPAVLYDLEIGSKITISGASSNNGIYTIENTSYLIVGYTTIRVTEPVTNADLLGTISYTDQEIYKLNRPAYTSITGLLRPEEAFNIPLSPKRAFNNNGAYIRSIFDLQDIDYIKFTSGDKNSLLSTTLNGETITENADVVVGSLPEKLFRPYYVKFKTKVPVNLTDLMRANPYSLIKLTYKDHPIYIYLWDGGIAPATDDSQSWIGLMGPNTDVDKLRKL